MSGQDDEWVTDHAVLRWLERIHGIDVEFFRKCIKSEIGNYRIQRGKIQIGGTYYQYYNNKLVTVHLGDRYPR